MQDADRDPVVAILREAAARGRELRQRDIAPAMRPDHPLYGVRVSILAGLEHEAEHETTGQQVLASVNDDQ